jgi:hypothetical protein
MDRWTAGYAMRMRILKANDIKNYVSGDSLRSFYNADIRDVALNELMAYYFWSIQFKR